ncbi:MAG: asparagine synthase (glutamine-hydrolyzing) [Rhodospirillaceae bacterium]|nr:asparagine synthase (glutamine-hydrolyzing) [Rhodospirillaceae bacterium]
MCGIAGFMTIAPEGPPPELLENLGRALAHRGPDGQRVYRAGNVGLVHDRLAIIDLATGDQPIVEPGGAAIVANAEIYNYIELRAECAGAQFSTASDCELPLHLYRRRGLDFVSRLRGMYALALHDPREGRLVLARDPFGIKPLYYVETAAGVAFASEAQALLAAGLAPRVIRDEARAELLQLHFVTGRDTIFAGIKRVLPGETLVIAQGRIVERHRLAALPEGGPEFWSEDEALERLDRALIDSVRIHQRSDVPYGLFLSGGVDSSALLALMAPLNERPVLTFTAGFSGTAVADERAHARIVARKVGAEHVEVEFGESDFWSLLPEIVSFIDDPAADYAVLPTYKLGQLARQHVKVVLSGEGGDELFAGYGRYRGLLRPWWLGGRAMRARGAIERFPVLRERLPGWRDGVAAAEINATSPGRTRLQIAQATDCAEWLHADLLTKLDRCLMAHGVEGRTPFLDPAVAAVAFRLPDRLKVRGGVGKWLLRRWLMDALPEAKPFEKKRGFTVPVGEWIQKHGRRLGPLVAAQPGIAALCEKSAVTALFSRPGKHEGQAAWSLLFYALWHRRHILDRKPAGNVFETLAAA